VRADRTPTNPARPKVSPNRRFQQTRAPSILVVGGLIAAAVVLIAILWATLGDSDDNAVQPPVMPSDGTAVQPSVPTSGIVAVSTFDPNGTDTTENDNLAPRAIDGDPATTWTTLCYSDRFLNGKPGVGLVVDLGSARTGTLGVDIASAPSQVRVYAVADGERPTSYGAWGEPVERFDSGETGSFDVGVDEPVRWMLVSFVELGDDAGCVQNPYRGAIAEIRFG
jgi:hypothetical protein